MARLLDRYKTDIIPALKTKLSRDNVNSIPKLQKIVVNMGVGKCSFQDKNKMEQAADQLDADRRPGEAQITKAHKVAISSFRLREKLGRSVARRVTLRRQADVRVSRAPDQRRALPSRIR